MSNTQTTTREIKTNRPVSQSDIITALKGSMEPIFDHFEQKLLEGDGKTLHMSISANGGKVNLKYGITDIEEGD